MRVTVGVSNRHVHLTKNTYEYLFDGKEIKKRNDLNQVGEFASLDTVDIECNGVLIEHVRVLGPFRDHNQIELLGTDLKKFDLEAPTRRSGFLDSTPKVTLIANGKRIETDGVIRAERHVHVPTSRENELGLHERDTVRITAPNCEFLANVKVSDNGYFEVHIDKDEALEYGITNGDEVEINRESR